MPPKILPQSCPSGTYTFTNLLGQTSCMSCPIGTFNNLTGQSRCMSCPSGTYNNLTGQSTCISCSIGTYNNLTGQSTCKSCPTGTFNNFSGQNTCISCPNGSYNNKTGQSICMSCPNGYFVSQDKTKCFNTFTEYNYESIQKYFDARKPPRGFNKNLLFKAQSEYFTDYGWKDLIVISNDINLTRPLDESKDSKVILFGDIPCVYYKTIPNQNRVGFNYGNNMSFRICFNSPTDYWFCNKDGTNANSKIILENDGTNSKRINGTSYRFILYPPGQFMSDGPFVMVLEEFSNNNVNILINNFYN